MKLAHTPSDDPAQDAARKLLIALINEILNAMDDQTSTYNTHIAKAIQDAGRTWRRQSVC